MWSAPATVNIFATSFAEIGSRPLSFLSCWHERIQAKSIIRLYCLLYWSSYNISEKDRTCRAYGKWGITAVIRWDDAVLHALMRISSSIRPSFTSPHPLWMMYTSSSRTDSSMLTLKRGSKLCLRNTNIVGKRISIRMHNLRTLEVAEKHYSFLLEGLECIERMLVKLSAPLAAVKINTYTHTSSLGLRISRPYTWPSRFLNVG